MTNYYAEPPWLVAKVDERLAAMEASLPSVIPDDYLPSIIMTLLTEPEEDTPEALAKWERTCDKCGRLVPDDEEFFTGQLVREFHGRQTLMTFGLCGHPCKDEEDAAASQS